MKSNFNHKVHSSFISLGFMDLVRDCRTLARTFSPDLPQIHYSLRTSTQSKGSPTVPQSCFDDCNHADK